jgi:O-methyltransferase
MTPQIDLDTFFSGADSRGRRHLGQLAPEFQDRLAAHYSDVSETACVFYHTIEFGDGGVVKGDWDLRGYEDVYLGGLPFGGKRVIEYGPASGWLSAWIARQGAALTVFDLPMGAGPDLTFSGDEVAADFDSQSVKLVEGLRSSWWLTRRRLGYEARAVYGDIFDPPADLGRYDVSVFSAILVHLMHPFLALERAAAITDEAMIVTDLAVSPFMERLPKDGRPHLLFAPSPPPGGLVHWWYLTPEAVCAMLASLGFPDQTLTKHSPPRMDPSPPMYTVVARRG